MNAEKLFRIIVALGAECVAPVWASRAGNEPPNCVDHNGTITFVDTGKRLIGVTARHVLERYREIAELPTAALAVNLGRGVTPGFIDLDVIDESAEMDVATIALPDIREFRGSTKKYFPISHWPIPKPSRGEPVTVVGFPGVDRKATEGRGTFTLQGIGMTVSNSPGRNVALADEQCTLQVTRDGKTLAQGLEPGGLSGAPGFFFRDGRFHLAGFVYEGIDRILFLAPGALIRPDGRLRLDTISG